MAYGDKLYQECHGYDLDGNPVSSRGFSVTYEIITQESAKYGDAEECGYICENVSLREAIGELNGAAVEPSLYPFDPDYAHCRYTTIDGDTDYRTGAVEHRSLHLPVNLTPSTRKRIARLLGIAV